MPWACGRRARALSDAKRLLAALGPPGQSEVLVKKRYGLGRAKLARQGQQTAAR